MKSKDIIINDEIKNVDVLLYDIKIQLRHLELTVGVKYIFTKKEANWEEFLGYLSKAIACVGSIDYFYENSFPEPSLKGFEIKPETDAFQFFIREYGTLVKSMDQLDSVSKNLMASLPPRHPYFKWRKNLENARKELDTISPYISQKLGS